MIFWITKQFEKDDSVLVQLIHTQKFLYACGY